MTIGILAGTLNPSGLISYINKLIINLLQEQNPEVGFSILLQTDQKRPVFTTGRAETVFLERPRLPLSSAKKAKGKFVKKAILSHQIDRLLVLSGSDVGDYDIPQYLFLHEAATLEALPHQAFNYLSGVLVTSGFLVDRLLKTGYPAHQVFLLEGVSDTRFENCSYDNKLATREKYAQGKQYFLCADFDMDSDRFVFLLKAYSLFKQRLQSRWKLVVAPRSRKVVPELEQLLSSYKYRDDVVLMGSLDYEELASLMAAAYGFLSVTPSEVFPVPVLEALQCGAPAICLSTPNAVFFGNGIWTTELKTPEGFAEKMTGLYKDETGRALLIENGETFLQKTGFQEALRTFSRAVLSAQN